MADTTPVKYSVAADRDVKVLTFCQSQLWSTEQTLFKANILIQQEKAQVLFCLHSFGLRPSLILLVTPVLLSQKAFL